MTNSERVAFLRRKMALTADIVEENRPGTRDFFAMLLKEADSKKLDARQLQEIEKVVEMMLHDVPGIRARVRRKMVKEFGRAALSVSSTKMLTAIARRGIINTEEEATLVNDALSGDFESVTEGQLSVLQRLFDSFTRRTARRVKGKG